MINSDGSTDTSLGNDGFQSLTNAFNTKLRTVFVDPSDRLVMMGDNLSNGKFLSINLDSNDFAETLLNL